MKKLTLVCSALAAAMLSPMVNAKGADIPSQFHGCWEAQLYDGEVHVLYTISKNKISFQTENVYIGNVISVKKSGDTYKVQTKGKLYDSDDKGQPHSDTSTLKSHGKSLIINGDKYQRTRC